MHGNKPFRVASVFDPALDIEAMGGPNKLVQYQKTRDPEAPKPRRGEKLMWFTTTRLSEDDMEYCEQAPTEQQKAIRAFQYGVTQVENAKLATDHNTVHPIVTPQGTRDTHPGEQRFWTDGQLKQFSRAMRVEIGSVVWARSFLAHESAPHCQLPRSLVDDFRMAIVRLVEETLQESDTNSDKPASPSEEVTSPDAA